MSQDFTVRMMQFILPRDLYDDLLLDAGELVTKYFKLSRQQLAVAKPESLETVSFMLGIDRVDAIADAFGDL